MADRTHVVIATAYALLSKVRRRSRVTPRTRIESATGKSTSATDTDVKDDTDFNCVDVPMKSVSDLSGFSWSPFCMYHCLTSVIQEARMKAQLESCYDTFRCFANTCGLGGFQNTEKAN